MRGDFTYEKGEIEDIMFCEHCGAEIDIQEGIKFCTNCGRLLNNNIDNSIRETPIITNKKVNKFSWLGCFAISLSAILILLMISFLIVNYSEQPSQSKYINDLKNGYLERFMDQTIGTAFNNFLQHPTWRIAGTDNDSVYVNVSGNIFYMGKKVKAILQFKLNKSQGDFRVYALEFNGIPQNGETIDALLRKIYGNTGEHEVTKDEYLKLLNYICDTSFIGDDTNNFYNMIQSPQKYSYLECRALGNKIINNLQAISDAIVPEGFGLKNDMNKLNSIIDCIIDEIDTALYYRKDNDNYNTIECGYQCVGMINNLVVEAMILKEKIRISNW